MLAIKNTLPQRTQRAQSQRCVNSCYVNSSALSASSAVKKPSLFQRSALTLIELLVVIVILTTLVGGVIPILSPNNDVRKIQQAARGLQTYITLAQSRAASTGRPHGIAFRESSFESGVALEVFGLEVPPPFAGFSSESRVRIAEIPAGMAGRFYGNVTGGNGGDKFLAQYNGAIVYGMSFVLATDSTIVDPYPPRTFRIGDIIDVGGRRFLIVDDSQPGRQPNAIDDISDIDNAFLVPNETTDANLPLDLESLRCIWINSSGQILPPNETLHAYKIVRQPSNSSESPYQFPSGIGIDLQGSVAEGASNGGWPLDESFYTDRTNLSANVPEVPNVVGVMFSPTGAVSSLIVNGIESFNVSRILLLIGRVENCGLDPDQVDPYPWVVQNANDKDEIEQKQEDINWLNLDSRLLSIAPRSGRVVVSETAFVNPALLTGAEDQIEAAHEFAHEMSTAE